MVRWRWLSMMLWRKKLMSCALKMIRYARMYKLDLYNWGKPKKSSAEWLIKKIKESCKNNSNVSSLPSSKSRSIKATKTCTKPARNNLALSLLSMLIVKSSWRRLKILKRNCPLGCKKTKVWSKKYICNFNLKTQIRTNLISGTERLQHSGEILNISKPLVKRCKLIMPKCRKMLIIWLGCLKWKRRVFNWPRKK